MSKVGLGIQQLLKSESDLDEAHHTCIYGLLTSLQPTKEQLRLAGERLMGDAVEPFTEYGYD